MIIHAQILNAKNCYVRPKCRLVESNHELIYGRMTERFCLLIDGFVVKNYPSFSPGQEIDGRSGDEKNDSRRQWLLNIVMR